ncbi:MAG: polysaccharide deacetylase family protein [Intestinibacillus sp.]
MIAVLLVAVLAAVTVLQTVRGVKATSEAGALRQQVETLTKENAELKAKVPAIQLTNDSFEYQSKYPEMVVKDVPAQSADDPKAVYLTFDDGPSKNTATILDALQAANTHATFFVIGKNIAGHEALLKRMVAEGHTVAIHTYSHDYKAIYASVDAFLDDFQKTYQAVYDACGVYPTMFRFPGGSINAYNAALYEQIIAEMTRRGFVYYDWSVSSEDATGKKLTSDQIVANVVNGVAGSKHPVVLMHDSGEKTATAGAVQGMVQQLTAKGYTCKALTNDVRPITFGYKTS